MKRVKKMNRFGELPRQIHIFFKLLPYTVDGRASIQRRQRIKVKAGSRRTAHDDVEEK
jgi:hypothetical protein